jgi:hypothetical protein
MRTGDIFEKVYDELHYYLSELEYPDFVLMELGKTGLCEKHPDTTLKLISKVIGPNRNRLYLIYLNPCLEQIIAGKDSLRSNTIFRRLFSLI